MCGGGSRGLGVADGRGRASAGRVERGGGARAALRVSAPSPPERPRPDQTTRGCGTPGRCSHGIEWPDRPFPLQRTHDGWPPCRSPGAEPENADVPRRTLGPDRGHGRGREARGTRRGSTPRRGAPTGPALDRGEKEAHLGEQGRRHRTPRARLGASPPPPARARLCVRRGLLRRPRRSTSE